MDNRVLSPTSGSRNGRFLPPSYTCLHPMDIHVPSTTSAPQFGLHEQHKHMPFIPTTSFALAYLSIGRSLFLAAKEQTDSSQKPPFALAHFKISSCPFFAALAQIELFQEHLFFLAHFNNSRCPCLAVQKHTSSSQGHLCSQPLQHIQVATLCSPTTCSFVPWTILFLKPT